MEHAMLNFIEPFEADVKSFRVIGILEIYSLRMMLNVFVVSFCITLIV